MDAFLRRGLAIATVAATCMVTISGASAGGLLDRGMRGSTKDAPAVHYRGSASRCYVRGDVGYSVAGDPSAGMDSPNYGVVGSGNEDMDGAWVGEIGAGCGSGSRGFRADFTLGYRGESDVTGAKLDIPGVHFPGTFTTQVSTLTAMANLYYDMGKFRNIVPYVGVGLGVAHHYMDDVSFALNAGSPVNNLQGGEQTNFAWSLMAGAAYQISERAILDVGYRYIDMGDVKSKRGNMCTTCVTGGSQDRLSVDDITAHEFKIGLRIHFGGGRHQTYK